MLVPTSMTASAHLIKELTATSWQVRAGADVPAFLYCNGPESIVLYNFNIVRTFILHSHVVVVKHLVAGTKADFEDVLALKKGADARSAIIVYQDDDALELALRLPVLMILELCLPQGAGNLRRPGVNADRLLWRVHDVKVAKGLNRFQQHELLPDISGPENGGATGHVRVFVVRAPVLDGRFRWVLVGLVPVP